MLLPQRFLPWKALTEGKFYIHPVFQDLLFNEQCQRLRRVWSTQRVTSAMKLNRIPGFLEYNASLNRQLTQGVFRGKKTEIFH